MCHYYKIISPRDFLKNKLAIVAFSYQEDNGSASVFSEKL